jgi:hypothetical protein
MSVILNEHDEHERGQHHCFDCGVSVGFPFDYPFVHWRGERDLFICGDCCRRIKNGLMADMVQVSAIMDFRGLGVMRDYTLVRKHKQTYEKELDKKHAEQQKADRNLLRAVENK